jgi:capsular polysaccharide biosynthesis protein
MAELRDYLRAYWSQRWLILGIIVVATTVTAITSAVQPVRYAVSESFAVNGINRQTTTEYQYNGYYALQAADLFAQTVVSWFSTPSVLRDVYDNAKIDPSITTLDSLTSRFKVKKYSAQNIVIRFSETTQARASTLAQSIRDVMEQKATRLNQSADGKALFEIVGTTPVITAAKPSVVLWSAVTLIISAGFALLIAALRFYLRQS